VLNKETLNDTILVNETDSFEMARQCALKEGIFIGISSGATLAAVAQKQAEMKPGSRVIIFSYDTGERYLSIEDLF
jgi:cysteine synthase A